MYIYTSFLEVKMVAHACWHVTQVVLMSELIAAVVGDAPGLGAVAVHACTEHLHENAVDFFFGYL